MHGCSGHLAQLSWQPCTLVLAIVLVCSVHRHVSCATAKRCLPQFTAHELDMDDPAVTLLLQSLGTVNANYKVMKKPEEAVYEGLKLQHRGLEKQRPSVLDLVFAMGQAMEYKMKANPRMNRRDALDSAISEYNTRMTKGNKMTGKLLNAVKQLNRTSSAFKQNLFLHYNAHRWEQSALALPGLQEFIYAPGANKYTGNDPLWRELNEVKEESSLLWLSRVINGFDSKVSKNSSVKMKDRQ